MGTTPSARENRGSWEQTMYIVNGAFLTLNLVDSTNCAGLIYGSRIRDNICILLVFTDQMIENLHY